MENNKLTIALWIGAMFLILWISISFLPIFADNGKDTSSPSQTDNNSVRKSGYFVMEEAIDKASANNESIRELFNKPYKFLGGIYNESGTSEYYIYIYNDPYEKERQHQQNYSYFELPIENRSSFYEIIIENETITSLNHITELPRYIRTIQSEFKIESQIVVGSNV